MEEDLYNNEFLPVKETKQNNNNSSNTTSTFPTTCLPGGQPDAGGSLGNDITPHGNSTLIQDPPPS